jgi:GNAT superfamily N-acetyltransferase
LKLRDLSWDKGRKFVRSFSPASADKIVNQIHSLLDLNIIFTHPSYRRHGAGDLIMNWGIQRAKEMGVEMWIDATIHGIPLYKKHGFVVVNENSLEPKPDNPDAEWKKLENELLPITMWQMWRPASGPYEEGKTVFPWATT